MNTNSIVLEKKALREHARQVRSQMTHHDVMRVSRRISEQLEEAIDWSTVKTVHTYIAIEKNNEIDTSLFCQWLWKSYPLIKIYTGTNQIYEITHDSLYRNDEHDIPVPVSTPVKVESFDVALVPCLMASKNGCRLGYGAGVMDVFLLNMHIGQKFGLCYKELLTKLPQEPHDIVLDRIFFA